MYDVRAPESRRQRIRVSTTLLVRRTDPYGRLPPSGRVHMHRVEVLAAWLYVQPRRRSPPLPRTRIGHDRSLSVRLNSLWHRCTRGGCRRCHRVDSLARGRRSVAVRELLRPGETGGSADRGRSHRPPPSGGIVGLCGPGPGPVARGAVVAPFPSGVKDPHQLSAKSETREFSRCGRGGLRASVEGIPAAVILGSPP